MVLWGWVTVRKVGGHAFTSPQGRAVDTDGRVALQLSTKPTEHKEHLTTHVVVVALRWGAERPQA